MCMRKLFGDDGTGVAFMTAIGEPKSKYDDEHQHEEKWIKAKNRYMKQRADILLQEAKIVDENEKSKPIIVPEISPDLLAKSTIYYGMLINRMGDYYRLWQRSKAYKILFYTTQPAHVIMIAAVLCVTSALVPSAERVNAAGHPHSRTASFIYLTSFVMHFGAQVWMTFVSGLSLYFALPRHTFGEVQHVLFPRYFSLNACLSLITLLIFVKHHPINTWDTEVAIQVGGMSIAFFLELLIRLYLTPPLLRLFIQKNALERAAGVGSEIGRHNAGPLKHCPHYVIIHRVFRRVHATIAMGNMVTMACTVLHLHYISDTIMPNIYILMTSCISSICFICTGVARGKILTPALAALKSYRLPLQKCGVKKIQIRATGMNMQCRCWVKFMYILYNFLLVFNVINRELE